MLRFPKTGRSQVLVDVFQCDAPIDHHDLKMVDQLAHLFRSAFRSFVFGSDPRLPGFFDDLLADEVRAFVELADGE